MMMMMYGFCMAREYGVYMLEDFYDGGWISSGKHGAGRLHDLDFSFVGVVVSWIHVCPLTDR